MLSKIKRRMSCRKKNILVIVLTLGCLLLNACGTDKKIEKEATKVTEAINNNNMKELGTFIFGNNNIAEDEELQDFFMPSDNENDGIIAKIIEQDSIKVKKITDEKIIYEVTVPDLTHIFQDMMTEEELSENEIESYIYNYIESASKTKIEIEVQYVYENDVFIADYETKEFLNGITGNMIDSYQELVQEAISENEEEAVE